MTVDDDIIAVHPEIFNARGKDTLTAVTGEPGKRLPQTRRAVLRDLPDASALF
jgi:hypothetical protein